MKKRRHHNNRGMRIIKRGNHLKPLKKVKKEVRNMAVNQKTRPEDRTEPKEHKELSAKTKRLSSYICWSGGRIVARIIDGKGYKRRVSKVKELEKIARFFHYHQIFVADVLPSDEFDKLDDGSNRLLKKLDKVEPFTIENARENGVLYYKGQLTIAATGFRFYAALVHNMLIAYNPETSCKGNFKDCPACSVIRAMFEEWGVM